MKTYTALALILALLLALAACGAPAAEPSTPETPDEAPIMTSVLPGANQKPADNTTADAPEESAEPTSQEETPDTAEIVARVLEMQGQPVEDLIDWLGEPESREYSSSCLVQGGQDGQLSYDGFTVYTLVQPDGTETIYDCE